MFRSLLLLLVFVISLSALSDNEILKRADGFMKSGIKSNHFRAYNDYKNLYLRSIMSDNKKLKLNALKGIVKSGNKLHIDISQYSQELSKLKIKSNSTKKLPYTKSKINISKKYNNIKVKSSHKLKSILFNNDKLILKFDKTLNAKQLNYFTLYDTKTERFKYVFDIHASMLTESKQLRRDNILKIRLAQHNSTTLRLVIENEKKIKLSFKKELSKLIINFPKVSADKPKKDVLLKYTSPERLDRNKIIVVDAGHGGKDPGAVGYKKI
jgi:N-acetylmuramoyl-L-alanine amidase